MLPSEEESDTVSVPFLSLEHNRVGRLKKVPRELHNSHCIGSSYGWLVLMDENADPFLLNLFSRVRIQLPNKEALPHIHCVKKVSGDRVCVINKPNNIEEPTLISLRDFHKCLIKKAVLSSSPSQNRNYQSSIYLRPPTEDCLLQCGLVEAWGFHGSFPVQTITNQPSYSIQMKREPWYGGRLNTRNYLVETSSDLLLVVRIIEQFVRSDVVPVYEEGDLQTDEDGCPLILPLILPHKTLQFRVYKLDFGHNNRVEVESLGNCVFFLGGNHSMSLSAHDFPEFKPNSIYFTDDCREQMDEDYLYGGHDMGIFNLDDKSVEPVCHGNLQRIQPPPLWVAPNP
ncbi:uncharacterized protein LOC132273101 [Cornus florida]|uniref:uncharacterized protein LOC132273101 n=1 Tax=Cornus florida TaxID=4283 RepID=UPI00289A8DE6|nr:uncharacterized protein LOC132273101 [Cornus florida]